LYFVPRENFTPHPHDPKASYGTDKHDRSENTQERRRCQMYPESICRMIGSLVACALPVCKFFFLFSTMLGCFQNPCESTQTF
jgi:hypothetical protein